MANSNPDNQFSDKKQPGRRRGKGKRNLILDAIKEQSLIGLSKESSDDDAEKAFFGHIAARAFNPEDQNGGMCLRLLADKGWSSIKPTMEHVEFTFDENAEPHVQAAQVMKAASDGVIAPDVANMFIGSIASMLKIEEVTEIKKELERIKEILGIADD